MASPKETPKTADAEKAGEEEKYNILRTDRADDEHVYICDLCKCSPATLSKLRALLCDASTPKNLVSSVDARDVIRNLLKTCVETASKTERRFLFTPENFDAAEKALHAVDKFLLKEKKATDTKIQLDDKNVDIRFALIMRKFITDGYDKSSPLALSVCESTKFALGVLGMRTEGWEFRCEITKLRFLSSLRWLECIHKANVEADEGTAEEEEFAAENKLSITEEGEVVEKTGESTNTVRVAIGSDGIVRDGATPM